jgi:HPt (histidine-containing phosphotransfer) domain-containing protein
MAETGDDAYVREQADLIGSKFLQRTRAEAVLIQGLLEHLLQGDATVIGQLGQIVHRIAGAGATFGYTSMSECARQMETLLRDLDAEDSPALGRLTEYSSRLVTEVTTLATEHEIAP